MPLLPVPMQTRMAPLDRCDGDKRTDTLISLQSRLAERVVKLAPGYPSVWSNSKKAQEDVRDAMQELVHIQRRDCNPLKLTLAHNSKLRKSQQNRTEDISTTQEIN